MLSSVHSERTTRIQLRCMMIDNKRVHNVNMLRIIRRTEMECDEERKVQCTEVKYMEVQQHATCDAEKRTRCVVQRSEDAAASRIKIGSSHIPLQPLQMNRSHRPFSCKHARALCVTLYMTICTPLSLNVFYVNDIT